MTNTKLSLLVIDILVIATQLILTQQQKQHRQITSKQETHLTSNQIVHRLNTTTTMQIRY
jgi:hypothetical protein